MLLGISLLGVVSASLAASLLKQKGPVAPDGIAQELQELKLMVHNLQGQLSTMNDAVNAQHIQDKDSSVE